MYDKKAPQTLWGFFINHKSDKGVAMAKIEDIHVCLLGLEELRGLLREIGGNLDSLPPSIVAAYRNLVASKPRPNLSLIQGHMSD